ncbi:MAG: hypothetical protein E6G88_05385 [Alphaproteobacteria bacterium]|nr:MAG: hypothetical protein E6G88_05385 [Alphaproteobacteria bacterium]
MTAAFEFRGMVRRRHSSRLSRPGLVLFGTTSASGGQFSSDGSSRIGDFEAVCRIELEAIIAKKLDAAYLSGWRQQLAEKMAVALRDSSDRMSPTN